MGILAKIGNFFTGDTVGTIADTIQDYFPPNMSEEEKAKLKLAIQKLEHKQQVDLLKLATEAEAEFNNRIKELEGTAKDLKQFGWMGSLIIFLRGCQRPVWGYLTLYMDIMWFSGQWADLSQQQESALWMVNVLVLGFLFGERAIKNTMPAVTKFMEAKRKNKGE